MKISKQAIASLTLSILWLLGIGSLIAIVLGHKARADIKKNSDTLKGKGIALAGLILGYLGIILILIVPRGPCAVGDKAKADLTCVYMATARRTLDMFKFDNGTYPTKEEGLKALIKNPSPTKYANYDAKAYLKELPRDAWRTPLVYLNNQGEIELISLGADKKEGGEDYDKDIFYSECKK